MIEIMEAHNKYVPPNTDGDPDPILWQGDGLSNRRSEGAKAARRNATDAWSRLEGLIPNPADWHFRLLLLEVTVF